MKAELGHVVLKAGSLNVSVPFYCSVLGMRERRHREVEHRVDLSGSLSLSGEALRTYGKTVRQLQTQCHILDRTNPLLPLGRPT